MIFWFLLACFLIECWIEFHVFFVIYFVRLFVLSWSLMPACNGALIRATEEELDGWMDGRVDRQMGGWME